MTMHFMISKGLIKMQFTSNIHGWISFRGVSISKTKLKFVLSYLVWK